MAWLSTDLIGVNITDVDTEATNTLGQRCTAQNTASPYGIGEFIYLKGVATTAAGTWVTINYDDYSTTLLADNAIGPVGIAMAATVASTYGWYQIRGGVPGKPLKRSSSSRS